MTVSEAQKRATLNYRKRSEKPISLTFRPPDYDIYEWVREQGNMQRYIKQLIREDMNKKKGLDI